MSTHQQATPGERARPPSNLAQRVVTTFALLPFVVGAAWAGGWVFAGIVGAIGALGSAEFCALGRYRDLHGRTPLAVLMTVLLVMVWRLGHPLLTLPILLAGGLIAYALELWRVDRRSLRVLVTLAAVAYAGVPAALLVGIRDGRDGLAWLIFVFVATWGTDTTAYFAGRFWGRTKLAPHISPGKTVEGALGGVVGGIVPTGLWLGMLNMITPLSVPLLVAAPLIAILGDLVESALKRVFHTKDSRLIGFDILPGHGGVLDRVDALILVTLLAYAYLRLTGLGG